MSENLEDIQNETEINKKIEQEKLEHDQHEHDSAHNHNQELGFDEGNHFNEELHEGR